MVSLEFSIDVILPANSASNRNEYQEYFPGGKSGWRLGLTLPPSCAKCLESWESQPSGILRTDRNSSSWNLIEFQQIFIKFVYNDFQNFDLHWQIFQFIGCE